MKQIKKSILVILALTSLCLDGFSQNFEWVSTSGGTGIDIGQSVVVDASGNSYTTGSFEGTVDFDPGPGIFNLTSAGLTDIFIQKLDANGDFIWALRIGNTTNDAAKAIAINGSGSIVLTGSYQGTVDFDPGAGTSNLVANSSTACFILNLSTFGGFNWCKNITTTTGSNPLYGYDISFDASGNVITCGVFSGFVDIDPGGPVVMLPSYGGGFDVFIQKLDPMGNFLWAKSIGNNSNQAPIAQTIDASGNVIVTGYFNGTMDFDPGAGTTSFSSAGGKDIFILKLDAAGNFAWAKRMGTTTDDEAWAIAADPSGNIYSSGLFYGTVDFDPGAGTANLISEAFSSDMYVQKLDASGNFVWVRQIGGTGHQEPRDMVIDANSFIFTTGGFSGTADFNPGVGVANLTSSAQADCFVLKLNSSGNYIWAKKAGGPSIDYSFGIAVEGNNIFTTGQFGTTVDFDPSGAVNNVTAVGGYDHFVLKLTCNSFGNIVSQTSCESYTWPASGLTYTSSGLYTHSVPNSLSCDSILKLDLTINYSDVISQFNTACNSYTWPINGNTYTATGTYAHNLTNIYGCDSTHILNLTINNSNSVSQTVTQCNSYTWPANGSTYTVGGVYNHTLSNIHGCDSNLTLNLTINSAYSNTQTLSACDSYLWPVNNNTYTSSGFYTEVLNTIHGCDSILSLDLTINNSTSVSQNITECDSYTWPANSITYTAGGFYSATIPSSLGCDSNLTLNLIILNSTSDTIVASSCGDYLAPDGSILNTTGLHLVTIPNAIGCDSNIAVNLTINTPDINVTMNADHLLSSSTVGTFQWLDCDNNYSLISGATAQSFYPTVNGNYAVSVDNSTCIDTSSCMLFEFLALDALNDFGITIFPNPSTNYINITTNSVVPNSLEILNIQGSVIYSGSYTPQINIQHLATGTYLLKVNTIDRIYFHRFIKN